MGNIGIHIYTNIFIIYCLLLIIYRDVQWRRSYEAFSWTSRLAERYGDGVRERKQQAPNGTDASASTKLTWRGEMSLASHKGLQNGLCRSSRLRRLCPYPCYINKLIINICIYIGLYIGLFPHQLNVVDADASLPSGAFVLEACELYKACCELYQVASQRRSVWRNHVLRRLCIYGCIYRFSPSFLRGSEINKYVYHNPFLRGSFFGLCIINKYTII